MKYLVTLRLATLLLITGGISSCTTTGNNTDQPRGSSTREFVLFQMPSYLATNWCRTESIRNCMGIPENRCFDVVKRYAANCGNDAIPSSMTYVSKKDIPYFGERYARCMFASHVATVGPENINMTSCQAFLPK